MNINLVLTYQPDIYKTLNDPGVQTQTQTFTLDQLAGFIVTLKILFNDVIDQHVIIDVPTGVCPTNPLVRYHPYDVINLDPWIIDFGVIEDLIEYDPDYEDWTEYLDNVVHPEYKPIKLTKPYSAMLKGVTKQHYAIVQFDHPDFLTVVNQSGHIIVSDVHRYDVRSNQYQPVA